MGRTTRHFNNALGEKGDAPKKLRTVLKEKTEKYSTGTSFSTPLGAIGSDKIYGNGWAEIGSSLRRAIGGMIAENFNTNLKPEVVFPAACLEVGVIRNGKSFNELLNPQPLIPDSDGNFPPIDDAELYLVESELYQNIRDLVERELPLFSGYSKEIEINDNPVNIGKVNGVFGGIYLNYTTKEGKKVIINVDVDKEKESFILAYKNGNKIEVNEKILDSIKKDLGFDKY